MIFYFKKTITTTNGVSDIEKGCADVCTDGTVVSLGPTSILFKCCSSNLCNFGISAFSQPIETKIFLLFFNFSIIFFWYF